MVGILEDTLNPLKANDPIVYSYYNSTKGLVRKRGIFVRKVKHTRKRLIFSHQKQMAVVKLIGNAGETCIEYRKLERV